MSPAASVYSFRKPPVLYLLVLVLLLQSITALICGAAMIYDPSGAPMMLPVEVLKHAPFSNFFIPGLFLFSFLGILPLLAVYELLSRRDFRLLRRLNFYHDYRVGWMLSLCSGFATLIWITVQLQFTQTFHFLQTVYAIVGMLILVLSLLPPTMRYCRQSMPGGA